MIYATSDIHDYPLDSFLDLLKKVDFGSSDGLAFSEAGLFSFLANILMWMKSVSRITMKLYGERAIWKSDGHLTEAIQG